jgi:hypothetical protein
MERLRQKRPRLALGIEDYEELHGKVLRRDGWKCQLCGVTINLEVHHIQSRSDLGSDVVDNLITLCALCHSRQHNQTALSGEMAEEDSQRAIGSKMTTEQAHTKKDPNPQPRKLIIAMIPRPIETFDPKKNGPKE